MLSREIVWCNTSRIKESFNLQFLGTFFRRFRRFLPSIYPLNNSESTIPRWQGFLGRKKSWPTKLPSKQGKKVRPSYIFTFKDISRHNQGILMIYIYKTKRNSSQSSSKDKVTTLQIIKRRAQSNVKTKSSGSPALQKMQFLFQKYIKWLE